MRKCVRCAQRFADCDLTLAGDCTSGSYHLCIPCADVLHPVVVPPSRGEHFDSGPGLHFGPRLGAMPWTNAEQERVFRELPKQ
jgi:hypothetical protein